MRLVRRSGALLTLLWRADRRRSLWLAGLAVLIGILPNAVVLVTGVFLAAVPGALAAGLGSPNGRTALLALVLLSVGVGASGTALAAARYLGHALGSRYAGTLSAAVARSCLAPPHLTHLEDARTAGEVESLTDFERSGLHSQLVPSLRMVVSRRVGGVGAALLLLPLGWWAPLVIAAGWIAAGAGLSRWMERGFAAARAEGGDRLRRAEYVRSLAVRPEPAKEIRIFGLAGWLRGEYVSTWHAAMAAVWQARRIGSRGLALGTLALVAAHAVALTALVRQAMAGRLGIGAVTVVCLALLSTEDLGFLGDAQWRVGRAASIAQQVLDLEHRLTGQALDRGGRPTPATATAAAPPPAPDGPAGITLTGVRFGYRGSPTPVLHGLDLHIRPGESVAVVGVNGAGKTTLMKLICGLYDPDQGTVAVDTARVGVIFQDFVRYELPLRDNVGFGSLHLRTDEQELTAALRDAGAADLLADLPHGWQTVLAPHYARGADLSGGQWQKVALARALLAVRGGAGLLILDEPTASLDIRAEAELFDRFLELTADVTTILVSHRLSSVRHAGRIVVLDGGRIVEDGSHDELLAAGGPYATMFRLQADRFAEAEA
ncbi:ABC transporter ATP-binding protein [Flindersiella endophytica]